MSDEIQKLEARVAMLEAALGVHASGWSLAFTAFACILAGAENPIPIEHTITALSMVRAKLPSNSPYGLILMGIEDQLRMGTTLKS